MQVWLGKPAAWLNGRTVDLETPPRMAGEQLLVPESFARLVRETRPSPDPPALRWDAAQGGPTRADRVWADPDTPGGVWAQDGNTAWHTPDGESWTQVALPVSPRPGSETRLFPASGGRLYAIAGRVLYARAGQDWQILLDKSDPLYETSATPVGRGPSLLSPAPAGEELLLGFWPEGMPSLGGYMLLSTDGGRSWTEVEQWNRGVAALVRHLGNSAILYYQTPWGWLHRSDDGGRTWREVTGPYCLLLALDPSDPGRLWINRQQGESSTTEVTTDAGQTWRVVSHAGQPSPARVERLMTRDLGGVLVSPDRGHTWHRAEGQPHDLHVRSIAWTRDGTAFWVATEEGLYLVRWI